jgi:poly(A) polymerase
VKLDPSQHSWMNTPATRAVMAALAGSEDGARFVGGAVRNALLGEPVSDIDIATRFTPDEVVRRLESSGLRAVATGIEHGTITAITRGQAFEVTSLRRDVETFGRRAVVAYTTDWTEDAVRRDFTINALYAGEDGTVFDYFGGADDIAARRVRFIGDGRQRIQEDYLRILRFFRFHAWYGRGEPDRASVAACIAEKHGLKLLSGERVQKELLLLLRAKSPMPVLIIMHNSGILAAILHAELQLPRLEHLIEIENANRSAPDALLRLAGLLPDAAADARNVAQALRLSNEARDRLVAAAEKDARIGASASQSRIKELIYRTGKARFGDQLLLRWADSGASAADPQWCAIYTLMRDWAVPLLPIDGNDVMALGIPEGPGIGIHLRDAEQWWVEHEFAPDRDQLRERLRDAVLKPR